MSTDAQCIDDAQPTWKAFVLFGMLSLIPLGIGRRWARLLLGAAIAAHVAEAGIADRSMEAHGVDPAVRADARRKALLWGWPCTRQALALR